MIIYPVIERIVIYRSPALYLSLSKHDPSRAYGNVYNNHIHHACACQMFWLFQGPNLHSPNLFHIAYNNHPIDCWGYYILYTNVFGNPKVPQRHIYLPCPINNDKPILRKHGTRNSYEQQQNFKLSHIFTKLFVDKYGYIRKHRYKKDKKQFLSKNYSKTRLLWSFRTFDDIW